MLTRACLRSQVPDAVRSALSRPRTAAVALMQSYGLGAPGRLGMSGAGGGTGDFDDDGGGEGSSSGGMPTLAMLQDYATTVPARHPHSAVCLRTPAVPHPLVPHPPVLTPPRELFLSSASRSQPSVHGFSLARCHRLLPPPSPSHAGSPGRPAAQTRAPLYMGRPALHRSERHCRALAVWRAAEAATDRSTCRARFGGLTTAARRRPSHR